MGSLSRINCRGRVMKVPECVLIVEQGSGKTFDGNIKSVLLKHADCFGVAEILKFLVKHIKAIIEMLLKHSPSHMAALIKGTPILLVVVVVRRRVARKVAKRDLKTIQMQTHFWTNINSTEFCSHNGFLRFDSTPTNRQPLLEPTNQATLCNCPTMCVH